MIINYTEKDGKAGMFVNENKNNIRTSKTGKSVSFLITESNVIILKKGGTEKTITGKALIKALFK